MSDSILQDVEEAGDSGECGVAGCHQQELQEHEVVRQGQDDIDKSTEERIQSVQQMNYR